MHCQQEFEKVEIYESLFSISFERKAAYIAALLACWRLTEFFFFFAGIISVAGEDSFNDNKQLGLVM